ncbi:MAG: DNA-protecting protein DprA [Chitinophagaceae bacterium]|nr:MAG: DNA-protecting protein DprA [Chitinophagaceae bacterium]
MEQDWLHRIALSILEGVGPVTAKSLIGYCGGEEAVFKSTERSLLKIPGIGAKQAKSILSQNVLLKAEQIFKDSEKYGIELIYFRQDNYPYRLKYLSDSPILLYKKGKMDLNHKRMLSIVGTRNATEYGVSNLENWMKVLQSYGPYIISGLAYGIDIASHRMALKYNLPTACVLANGLDTLYPKLHMDTAKKMLENDGAWISEFPVGTELIRENFPRRNRIIAALCDALIVVETKRKGGSIISAEYANEYSKEVYALPGAVGSATSEGCNYLIKTHKAQLLDDIEDLIKDKDWQKYNQEKKKENHQTSLNLSTYDTETQTIINVLMTHKAIGIDKLVQICALESTKIASILLNLEFEGLVKVLPGKRYKINL